MASREVRRSSGKNGKKKRPETEVEKRRLTHPLLYAGSVILLVIIVVTFVGAPVISGRAGRGRINFGAYRGEPIDFFPGNYLARQRELIAESVRQQEGEQQDLGSQIQRIWRNAFERTLLHTALLMAAEESGLWVSTDKVDEILINNGPYRVDGRFSEELYQNTNNAEKLSTRTYFREQLIEEQVIGDLLNSQLTSSQEVDFFKAMTAVQKRFSFVRFPFSAFSREESVRFGLENAELFQKIKLSRILIKSGAKEAEEIRAKLEDRSASFEELARAHSKDSATAGKGGELGWRYYYDLEKDFDSSEPLAVVFGLAEGEITPVLESRFGWVIYRVDSPAVNLDLGQAEDSRVEESVQVVEDYIMQYEKGMVEDYFLERAEDFRTRAAETGFMLASLEQDLMPYQTDYFPVNYQGIFFMSPVRAVNPGIDISSASYNREFFLTAYSLAPDQISEAVILDDQIVVLKLEDQRQQPAAEADVMDRYYSYFAYQSQETDLEAVLLAPELIEDNFYATFSRYIAQ
jgi:parvulin-like peptidyl-prolyl isomerase